MKKGAYDVAVIQRGVWKVQNLKQEEVKVKWYGYLVLFLGILFFSGLMKDAPGPLKALDFNNVLGSFGKLGTLSEGAGNPGREFPRHRGHRPQGRMAVRLKPGSGRYAGFGRG